MTTKKKPPLGVLPRWAWIEQRIEELEQAIERYKAAKMDWPPEWAEELEELRLDHEPLPEKVPRGVRMRCRSYNTKTHWLYAAFGSIGSSLLIVTRDESNRPLESLHISTEQAKNLAEWIQRYIRKNG